MASDFFHGRLFFRHYLVPFPLPMSTLSHSSPSSPPLSVPSLQSKSQWSQQIAESTREGRAAQPQETRVEARAKKK